jgi:hypothetical protein
MVVEVVGTQESVPRQTRRTWLHIFLVPVAFVAWASERRGTGELTSDLVFSTFLTGGVLGVPAAARLRQLLNAIPKEKQR